MIRKRILLFSLAAFLSACGQPAPVKTLNEKLQGKTPEEKREVLRLACLDEAEYTTRLKKAEYKRLYGAQPSRVVSDTDETWRLKMLCRRMADSYEAKE
jgi:hypothetical protein